MADSPAPNSGPSRARPVEPQLDLPWEATTRTRAPQPGQSAIQRSGIGLRLLQLSPLLLCLPLPAALGKDLPPYPSNAEFRQLQLAAQDCGRENNDATCTPARDQADRLIDHPRLSASCKDVLWEIREGSEVTAVNSYVRREALNRAAGDLMVICRAQAKPTATSDKPSSPFQQ